MKQAVVFFILAILSWSCSDIGVDPRFSTTTVIPATFEIPAGIVAGLDTLSVSETWFDTTAINAELRGAGKAGADVDSVYITRVKLSTEDAGWLLGNLSKVSILVGNDTVVSTSIPDVTGREIGFAKSALRPAAFNLPIKPGDSVAVTLLYTLRSATVAAERIRADISVEAAARAKFE